ncbi:hypothetical protein SDC9_11663 [bioreactor metagenome]|uniref:Type II toxin-antitoxin system HicA family toxin n=1 Tax=bioreactor metagenome TaxID=1076179 RepID=A0A644TG92_9ZZZZ
MSPISRDAIESSLRKKGFRQDDRDHRFYYFFYQNRRSSIRTKISTGTHYKDYSDKLLKSMKTQLHMPSTKDLKDFLICTKSEEEYINILQNDGIIT